MQTLIVRLHSSARDTWEDLSSLVEIVEPRSSNRQDFIAECKAGKLDGVVAVYRTFPSVSVTGHWDEELVQALPESLKLVAHNGTVKQAPLPISKSMESTGD